MLEASPINTLGMTWQPFVLPDALGQQHALADMVGESGTLIMFICNHCPFVEHIMAGVVEYANEYFGKGIKCVAITSNDIESHPEDAPKFMPQFIEKYKITFPYLYDADQSVAKAFDAACTPEFLLFSSAGKLFYRGQFDASRPYTEWDIKFGRPQNTVAVTGVDLRAATDNLLNGIAAPLPQIPSVGCNIKWRSFDN
jgi:peroxiredoxin